MPAPRRTSQRGRGKAPRRAPVRTRPVRRGQLISPFGVGAITDFRNDEALMCAGLEAWFRAEPEADLRIAEERLQQRLRCDFFVKPPEYNESETTSRQKVPYVRFPLWYYCPRCFRMQKVTLFGEQPRCTSPSCSSGRYARRMIPVRIVAICEQGHIEDFPFREWIGCQCAYEHAARLYFKAGRSAASLAGIKIECQACNRRRSLAGAFEEGALGRIGVPCSGAQPWLGRERGQQSCAAALQTVQRGGSNVYFPLITSSIYIPPTRAQESEAVQRVLDNPQAWMTISSVAVDGRISRPTSDAVASMFGVNAEALAAAAQARMDGRRATAAAAHTEEDFRRQEYEILRSGAGSPFDELFVERKGGREYAWLGDYVSGIGLVRKLRKTRVLVGFSRLVPKTDRADQGIQRLAVDTLPWLPAAEVRGEGIFIELSHDAVEQWMARSGAGRRTGPLVQEFNQRRAARGIAGRNVDPRFMMIHTLAHALIKELTFFCGYGSASLRERLYCNLENPAAAMNGFLIYTASGDSEGTLGGLVAQAAPGRFEQLVDSALRRSLWCSNDPVCMESPGGGAFSSNLSACHGCALLPETSCEEGNRLLDRALLVGTIDDAGTGFFGGRHSPARPR